MKVNLIYGAPCSGKTTYVYDNHKDGEAVYDLDSLDRTAALKELNTVSDSPVRWAMNALRQGFVDACNQQGVQVLWMICSYPTDKILTAVAGCEVEQHLIKATKQECYDHLEADDTRPDKDAWRELIDKWFAEHAENTDERSEEVMDNEKTMPRFWNFSSANRLDIYGTISADAWFDDDVTPQQLRDELDAKTGDIDVYINSPGGDCFAASQIYTMLKEYKGKVTVKIDGIAASAASVIAMAGDEVLMAPTAQMMIHNPATLAFGDKAEMQKVIEMLDEVKESIINAYEIKTGLSRAKISHMMDMTKFMHAGEAIELGFADRLIDGSQDAPAQAKAFAPKLVEDSIARMMEKANEPVKDEEPEAVEEPETDSATDSETEAAEEAPKEPSGRNVDELLAELEKLEKEM